MWFCSNSKIKLKIHIFNKRKILYRSERAVAKLKKKKQTKTKTKIKTKPKPKQQKKTLQNPRQASFAEHLTNCRNLTNSVI